MELSANNKAYLTAASESPAVIPSIVYSKLKELGYVEKVEGAPSQGRGKITVVATLAGKRALV
jgi:hypothetical protein